MKNIFRFSGVIILIFSFFFIHSCKKDTVLTQIKKDKISGYVQKGPFINGSSIQMFELNSSLNQTGKVFSTQITSNMGSFEINDIELSSQFVEFSASGYYFNEITGAISLSPLSLYGISDITDNTTVNVNILTHLEKSRVNYLVSNGKVFSEAKDTAQKEVLAIFGYEAENIDNSEMLDISLNKEENAILLAISVILQGYRSAGDLTELLANITSDIQQDGRLNDVAIISELRSTALSLDLGKIRSNLEKRYQDLGISTTIPGFEKYINDFLSFTGLKPAASTQAITNFAATGATLNGIVCANDLSTIVTFEYGLTADYGTIVQALNNPLTGHLNISVSADITGLNPGTLYHFRVKAVNSQGMTYGTDMTFKTFNLGTVTDIDGNIYVTIEIGTQVWMQENLKTTRYQNGDLISTTSPASLDISSETGAQYQWAYDGNESNVNVYGRLYTWNVAYDSRNVCPTGWHVPTSTNWATLVTTLGGSLKLGYIEFVGSKMKERGTSHWQSPNSATNESGFTALPGGYRQTAGLFRETGFTGYWWSTDFERSQSGYSIGLYNEDSFAAWGYFYRNIGVSVRCVKD
jgi:uncharacterized protein (TIGR02145 family)